MTVVYITATEAGMVLATSQPDMNGKTLYELKLPEGTLVTLLTDQLNALRLWLTGQPAELVANIVLKVTVGE